MKQFLIILYFFISLSSMAQTYYVKAFGGTGNGLSDSSAWSYSYYTSTGSAILGPGDSVLFKRNDSFYGQMVTPASGSFSNPIYYGAYGTGGKPIITGFLTLASWTLVSGSIYEAPINSGLRLNMLTIDGKVAPPGRWPNNFALNRGYATASSGTVSYPTSGTVTSSDLASAPGLYGTEMCSQPAAYLFNSREPVIYKSGNTVTFVPKHNEPMSAGWGFFFQNGDSLLDLTNEWAYHSSTNTIRIYGNPAGKVIKAGTVNYLVNLTGRSYITIDSLAFEGADSVGIDIPSSVNHCNILNCDIAYSGVEGISCAQFATGVNNNRIEGCNITNSNSSGIKLEGINNLIIRSNIVRLSGVIPGAGMWASNGYHGISWNGDSVTCENNVVDSVGVWGISFSGGKTQFIHNNWVNMFCLQMSDGGGIYTNGQTMAGKRIIGNVVTNGIGNTAGTPFTGFRGANCFYVDEGASNVLLDSNTAINTPSYGYYIHQGSNNIIRRNLAAPGTSTEILAGGFTSRDDYATGTGVHNKNNRFASNITFIPTNSQAQMMAMYNLNPDSVPTHSLDSNIYIRPNNPAGGIWAHSENDGKNDYYNLPGAFNKYGWEAHGVEGPSFSAIIPLSYGSNLFANSSFNSGASGATADALKNSLSTELKLDGSSLKATTAQSAGTELDVLLHFGAQTTGKTFEVTFSAIGGATEAQNLKCYWMKDGSYAGDIAQRTYIPLKSTRTENKLYATLTDNASDLILVLENRAANYPYWIDNVVCREVLTSSPVLMSDSIRVEYNETRAPKTINLGAVYRDFKDAVYQGSIILQPYSSAILQRIGALPAGPYKVRGKFNINQ